MARQPTRPDEADRLRRKRLYFRSRHRGTKEMDLILGAFAERHLAALSPAQLARYEALLEVPDGELYGWISGRLPVPEAHDHDVLAMIRNLRLDN